ncbi:granule-bound starch synthase 1, chloroplastic/amyloplastic-like [Humulus lupulus]|uniref:granule-bound starch synthase 1, chloroplastic/amyloplastic-like n=1 Tax=Humulus lupulus TaxID=3486 RepID=UPI002B414A7D|nr:granule-bound starch synthase 1, chloroplastic/amyloplastic-like [Humulus lupulus]XP_062074716.1 granule-bound starch synthase 1, chloroplastic/amyloplastic-like [Humulus lupulus]
MAMITASRFVSRTSGVAGHGSSGSEMKANLAQISQRNQTMTHSGLRSLDNLSMLKVRSRQTVVARKAMAKVEETQNDKSFGKIVCGQGMSLVFVSAEVGPWSKTGGLGDVLGGLPPAMAANGHRVMTIAPRYDQYKDAWDTGVLADIPVGGSVQTVRFFHCHKRGVDRVFVDHPWFLEKVWGKTGSKIYGPVTGKDYDDNQLRFSLLCLAALEAPRILNLNSNEYYSGPYGEDVVFIANDWHTALIPCYLKTLYQPKGIYKSAKVTFCIHNIAYQGRFAFTDFSLLNLPDQFKSSFDFIDGYVTPVKGRKINWMKAGIIESDRVVTVSPYYAKELISGEDRGCELDNIIRKTGISGIVNGMDDQEWNPATDKYLSIKYDVNTVFEAKPLLKETLQAEVGLPVDTNIPVVCFVGRLEEQKGSDILVEAIDQLIDEDVQIILLGTGKKYLEKMIVKAEKKYPDKVRAITKFNVPLAHVMIAGSDFIAIPSRFEPCGLIQLQAMRNGTIPCVASTGGLVDTVKEGFTGFQMGAFNVECEKIDPVDVTAVVKTIKKALSTYGTPVMKEMIQNCMAQDLSWKEPAKQWEKMLLSLEVAGSEPGIEGEEIAPMAKENLPTP